jgi:hypothetical protein
MTLPSIKKNVFQFCMDNKFSEMTQIFFDNFQARKSRENESRREASGQNELERETSNFNESNTNL